jgi:hypothetical protein
VGSGQFCVNVCLSLGYCSADGFTVASDADHKPDKIMTECSNKKGDYAIDSGLVVTLRTHTRGNMGAFACCRRPSWKFQCACGHQEVLIFYIYTCCMTEAACINTKPCLFEWTLNLMNSGCKPWKVCTKHAHRHNMTGPVHPCGKHPFPDGATTVSSYKLTCWRNGSTVRCEGYG